MFDIQSIYQAQDVSDAIRALVEHPNARVIAGGTDLLLRIRQGKLARCALVSIHGLPELTGIHQTDQGEMVIGALTTFRQLTQDPLIRENLSMLAGAAAQVGAPQIQAMGTVGGNLCNGATSADTASSLFAYQAQLVIAGPADSRTIPIDQFYTGPGQVDLQPWEILREIRIPRASYQDCRGRYYKYALRNALDIALLGAAVLVRLSPDRRKLDRVRVAFGVAGPTPMRALETERALTGLPLAEAVSLIPSLVRAEIQPRDSQRASRAFRLHIGGVIAQRALNGAIQDGGGAL